MNHNEANQKYMIEQLQPFEGAKIVQAVIAADVEDGPGEGEGFFGLVVLRKDRQAFVLWVNCDPEGNGPGWLDICEIDEVTP